MGSLQSKHILVYLEIAFFPNCIAASRETKASPNFYKVFYKTSLQKCVIISILTFFFRGQIASAKQPLL